MRLEYEPSSEQLHNSAKKSPLNRELNPTLLCTGSQPTVRINGRMCQRTMFAAGVVRDETNAVRFAVNEATFAGTGDSLVCPTPCILHPTPFTEPQPCIIHP